jgi:DNA-3-methyladenine glycosylase II
VCSDHNEAATFTITPAGPFSLKESALFGFGQRAGADWDSVMRMAFCLDDMKTQVGVAARQPDVDGPVSVTIVGIRSDGRHATTSDSADRVTAAIRRHVARVLSLTDDATGYAAVARRDPVVARLQAAAPGLRPPLFYSAYEAAAWSVLSARRPREQMAQVRQRLSESHGTVFMIDGQTVSAFPTPARLLAVSEFPGIPSVKLDRLHGVATAALDGSLDTDTLRELEPETALAQLQRIGGIGPFYANLILIRATGVSDVLPADEPRVRELAARLYELPTVPTASEFAVLAETWTPWRTWVVVLIRAAAGRVLP